MMKRKRNNVKTCLIISILNIVKVFLTQIYPQHTQAIEITIRTLIFIIMVLKQKSNIKQKGQQY
ncbi:hypothetical protein IC007_2481 [Sulfuracidifex tepidarius]|uniref:Uncharacterized protein n=1 Tax=Sulfuracidifex tepidarius TaxID=1294262 RepID=A0A510E623_9CREN|nr:hypothetical protein IC007_2481 [Sulfuracidifex tepidarius]